MNDLTQSHEAFYRQHDFFLIGELSDRYVAVLRAEGIEEKKCNAYAISLKTLYWQAGENMGYLLREIDAGIRDGKKFAMMLSYAWSIIESLEDIVNKARLGDKITEKYTDCGKEKTRNKWVVMNSANNIRKKLFGVDDPTSVKYSDWNYVRFLRSFISVHPLNTNYRQVTAGFLPNERACCQFVDYILDEPWYESNPDRYHGADIRVSLMYDSGG